MKTFNNFSVEAENSREIEPEKDIDGIYNQSNFHQATFGHLFPNLFFF